MRGSFWRAVMSGAISCGMGLGAARAATSGGGSAGSDTPTSDTLSVESNSDSDVPSPANVMSLMDKLGAGKTLDDLGIDIYGHVEGGYTYQFFKPNDQLNGRNYDFVSNRAILNQAAVNIERDITPGPDHFDIGFRVEAMEGTDAGLTESDQSFRTIPSPNGPAGTSSDYVLDVGGNNSSYQFDLPDLYLDFNIPVGNGIRVRAGRFEFFKPIDPNERLFYSTTFVYTNALPFTNTGVTAAYDFNDKFGIEAGFSRGYNITMSDFNGSVDFIGKGHLDISKKLSLVATTSIGPELARDSRDYTVLFDVGGNYKLGHQASVAVDAIYAHQFGNSATSLGYSAFPSGTSGHLPASYYGVSGTIVQQINPYFSLGGRLEWFRDDGGLLTGASRTLYEATVGTTITPMPRNAFGQNLKIRPEVRCDYSNVPFFGPTPAGTFSRRDQLTFGADVIYNF
jgi:hypothetical protein